MGIFWEVQCRWMQWQNNIGCMGPVCCPNTSASHAADSKDNDLLKTRAEIKGAAKKHRTLRWCTGTTTKHRKYGKECLKE